MKRKICVITGSRAEYGSIYEQILNDNSELYSFSPDILLILPDYRDIKEKPSLFSANSEIEEWVSSQYMVYNNLWSKVSSKLHKCQIFQALFVVPHYRSMGALEGNYIFSPQNYLRLLNLELIKNKSSNVTFIDFDYHASNFGKSRWFDDSQFFQSKQTISFDALSEICHATARLISSYFGKMKKSSKKNPLQQMQKLLLQEDVFGAWNPSLMLPMVSSRQPSVIQGAKQKTLPTKKLFLGRHTTLKPLKSFITHKK